MICPNCNNDIFIDHSLGNINYKYFKKELEILDYYECKNCNHCYTLLDGSLVEVITDEKYNSNHYNNYDYDKVKTLCDDCMSDNCNDCDI